MRQILIIFICLRAVRCFWDIQDIIVDKIVQLPQDFSLAVKDIAEGIPTRTMTVVRGNSTNIRSQDIFELLCLLNQHNIPLVNLDLSTKDNKDKYYQYLKMALDTSEERTSLILCEPEECENILGELTENNLIHRMILYIFYWPYGAVSKSFLDTISEAMRVAVITNPKTSVALGMFAEAHTDSFCVIMHNRTASSLMRRVRDRINSLVRLIYEYPACDM